MRTRLVLCFDGTWDRPAAATAAAPRVESNVCRFYEAIAVTSSPGDAVQTRWYDTGVGTDWYDRVGGGAFGFGLDQKIQDGYSWLAEHYPDPDPGDIDVFVIGFSRGAYTARSLVGMIRNVGLLKPGNDHRVSEAYALYRRRDDSADTADAQDFRARYARAVRIRFLGVWDTVGALGIPLPALQWLNAKEYAFHDTELSGIVGTAAQAVAIDEHRIDYQVALWKALPKEGQSVEQRWFVGAHADVGGGYDDRRLSDITLDWMMGKAARAGLVFAPATAPALGRANWTAPLHDSYREFLGGLYADTHPPYFRPITLAAAQGGPVNETLDGTALERRGAEPDYRPANPGFPP